VERLIRLARALQRSPLAPLHQPAKQVVLAGLRGKAVIESAMARGARVLLRVLPIGARAKLKQDFTPIVRLDYRPHEVLLHADSPDALYRAAACRKEPETIRWIEQAIRPGDVMYDVGANVGAYALVASKHCGGAITVLAFEPSFATYDQLCRNILLNGCEASVIPHLMCLTERPGLVRFGHTSLAPGSALHISGGTPEGQTSIVYWQEIPGFSIDFLVSQFGFPVPNHIKIDVDGSELNVLRGAADTLDSDRVRTIQVEVSPQDPSSAAVGALLAAKNFRHVSDTARSGGNRWSNRLFVRP
jgi:FkbM family methyltransferase